MEVALKAQKSTTNKQPYENWALATEFTGGSQAVLTAQAPYAQNQGNCRLGFPRAKGDSQC